MLTQLDGVLPPNGRGHTARALGILILIRHHWGPDFYKQIPLRQGPVGEKILSTLCRLAKSTTLASFAARIQLIVTDRVKNSRQKKGALAEQVLLRNDLKAYLKRFPEPRLVPMPMRKRPGFD
jgi:hypothetical protein